ncbi:hypothetical protein AKJ09_03642 [Labilithrix luteola]|uniref:Uncharacterized protein n=1 Tax=Labilithrix luteola TaxID=1391654 RepID=A0A0K1PTV9_9BACT|nr:hypothetical protein AKJ09_03642 [Labilithrix luteola]
MGAVPSCNEPFTEDPNANAPPAVIGVVFRDALDIDDVDDLAGAAAVNGQTPGGEASAMYWFRQNVPTPLAGPVSVYPSQFPQIVFNKLMDGSTIELAQIDPITHQPQGFCAPAPGSPITMAQGETRVALLRTCYSPSDKLVTVQPASAMSEPPNMPPAIHFLAYGATYTVTVTDAVRDKQGRSIGPAMAGTAPFSVTMNVGPFALFSVTDVGETGAQPSGPTVTTYLYGADVAFADEVTQTLPAGTRALRMVFTGPIAPPPNADGTVPEVTYPGFAIHRADADFNEGDALSVHFTTSDGRADNAPGTTDPRVLFAYAPGRAFLAGNYVLSIPLSFSDDGSVTGAPVLLSDNAQYPPGKPIKVRFTVPSEAPVGGGS